MDERMYLPKEDYVHANTEHHRYEAVTHQPEVPPPLLLPLLCRHLLTVCLIDLLPVTHVVLGLHAVVEQANEIFQICM